MAPATLNTFLHRLRRLLGGSAGADVTDAQLLERFLRERDESAFTTLVQRHGPMVLGLCRRLLRREADAEDAFQATFLVLARKAASIRKQNSVAGWLYGVAARVAARARVVAGRLRLQPAEILDRVEARPEPGADQRDLQALVHEELGRLSESDRAVLVLCCLEGKTHRQAAGELGWPRGSVARRLKAARARLRSCLTRRGVTLPVGALAAVLSRGAVSACDVPAEVLQTTVNVAASPSVGQLLSAHAAALVEGELRMFGWTRWKAVAAACLAVMLIGTGGGLVLLSSAEGSRPVARAREGLPLGADAKAARDQGPPPQIPLNARELLETVGHADRVFIGRVKTADLSVGFWSGWAMCLRSATYEVTATLKGPARKEQTVEFIILYSWCGDYVEPDNPRLRRNHFPRGAKHLVCSGSDGKQQVVLFWTPSVPEAIRCIHKAGKPEALPR